MPVVGYATLQVIPSLKGVHGAIQKELGGAAGQAGKQAGASMGSGITAGITASISGASRAAAGAASSAGTGIGARIGQGISSSLTKATQAAYRAMEGGALAAGAVVATSLVKGWGRLTTIQDSTAALTVSLGDAGAAAGLLDEVLNVVRGTPFNLDQFAAAAQQMVGFGIAAEKVPRYLTAIGEASATQGTRAGEFAERLSTVFGQIAAQGQVSLADVWRISDTGVNALGILANSFGVTREEMKDMISQGAVPAGLALDALADGILNGTSGPAGATNALAGTMASLREQMSGAVSGINSAMARLGAGMLKPFSPAITAGANAFAAALDAVGERAGDFLDGIGDSDALDGLIDLLGQAPDAIIGLLDGLGGVAPIAGLATGALASMGVTAVNSVLGPFEKILPNALSPFKAGILGMVLAIPEARAALLDLGKSLIPIIAGLGEDLAPLIQAVSDALGEVMPAAVAAAGEALLAVATIASAVIDAVVPLGIALLDIATPVLVTALGALASALGLVGDFLADHEGVIQIVATAYAVHLVRGLGMAAVAFVTTQAAAARSSAAFMIQQIQLLAMTRGVSNAAAAWGVLKQSVASSTGAQALAIGAIAFGVYRVATSASRSEEAARDMFDAFEEGVDMTTLEGLYDVMGETREQIRESTEKLDDYEGGWGKLRYVAEGLTPMKNGLDDATAALEEGEGRLEGYTDAAARLVEATQAGKMSADELSAAIQEADIDPATASWEEWRAFVGTLDEATYASHEASGGAADYAAALQVLADESATTEERVSALQDALDGIFNPKLDLWNAITQYEQALDALGEAVKENGPTLSPITEAGQANRDVLAEMLTAAIGYADAIAAASGNTDDGRNAMLMFAEQIRQTADEVGFTESDVASLSQELGLLPEDLRILLGFEDEATPGIDEAASRYEEARQQFGVPINVGLDQDALSGFGEGVTTLTGMADLAQSAAYVLSVRLKDLDETPASLTLNGEDFFPTADMVTSWTDWYDDSTPTADALLNAGGAQLGFTSLSEWARFYESLDPATRAHLDTLPAQERFTALQGHANWWRMANPLTRAGLSGVEAVEAQLRHLARERVAEIRVNVGGYGSVDAAERGYGHRWGGIHEVARMGRLPANVTKHPTILFGERETGGEAMIPRLGDWARSTAILRQAAGWYGMDVVDKKMTAARWGMAPATPMRATATTGGASFELVNDQPIILDGREIGRSRSVYSGMARQAKQDRR